MFCERTGRKQLTIYILGNGSWVMFCYLVQIEYTVLQEKAQPCQLLFDIDVSPTQQGFLHNAFLVLNFPSPISFKLLLYNTTRFMEGFGAVGSGVSSLSPHASFRFHLLYCVFYCLHTVDSGPLHQVHLH